MEMIVILMRIAAFERLVTVVSMLLNEIKIYFFSISIVFLIYELHRRGRTFYHCIFRWIQSRTDSTHFKYIP